MPSPPPPPTLCAKIPCDQSPCVEMLPESVMVTDPPKLFAGVKSLLVELREDPQHRRVICGLPCHARESGLSWHTAGETPRRQFCDDILDLCSGIFPAVVLIQIVVRPARAFRIAVGLQERNGAEI